MRLDHSATDASNLVFSWITIPLQTPNGFLVSEIGSALVRSLLYLLLILLSQFNSLIRIFVRDYSLFQISILVAWNQMDLNWKFLTLDPEIFQVLIRSFFCVSFSDCTVFYSLSNELEAKL